MRWRFFPGVLYRFLPARSPSPSAVRRRRRLSPFLGTFLLLLVEVE